MGRRRRRPVDPTDDWEQLELLCFWEEQREYERIRPLVLFGRPVPERSAETGRVVRHHPGDLSRAFFSTVLVRKLDASSYARVKHWRVYAEEGLARCEVAVWARDGEMAVEYGGRTLSSYDVSLSREAKLEAVTNPRLFATQYNEVGPNSGYSSCKTH